MPTELPYTTVVASVILALVSTIILYYTWSLPRGYSSDHSIVTTIFPEPTVLSKSLASALLDSVILPNDTTAFKRSMNAYWAQQECEVIPACVVRPRNVQELCTAVTVIGREYDNIIKQGDQKAAKGLFAIRSGGHSPIPGAATVEGGAVIDMSLFCEVTPSEDGSSVVIGTGTKWMNVSSVLDEKGLAVVGGRNSAAGVGGLTLGATKSFSHPATPQPHPPPITPTSGAPLKAAPTTSASLHAYDPINVRDTWFSTATYFRRADFYQHGNPEEPLINYFWTEQLSAFDKALAALPIPGQRLQIPADNFTVEAIWYPAEPASTANCTQRPAIILGNGYDGAQEDLYHTFVVPARARGWNALTYEGPGQPKVRREQNIGFIPDWERVVTPVIDYLLTNQSAVVDPARLPLLGYSFGGYLAARAAAFEPRISTVLLDGGIYDAYEGYYNALPEEAQTLLDSGNATAFNAAIDSFLQNPETPTNVRWGAEQGLWSYNTQDAHEYFQLAKGYRVKEWIDQIKVPTWVADVSDEGFYPNQSIKVAEALGDRATYHLFEGVSGYHCQVGSLQDLNTVMWVWLNKVLG